MINVRPLMSSHDPPEYPLQIYDVVPGYIDDPPAYEPAGGSSSVVRSSSNTDDLTAKLSNTPPSAPPDIPPNTPPRSLNIPTNTQPNAQPNEPQGDYDPCLGSAVITSIFAVIACTFALVNVELVKQRVVCDRTVISTKTTGVVVNKTCSSAVYFLGDCNCTMNLINCQAPEIGSSAVIYRSDMCSCDTQSHKNGCDWTLYLFNFLYTLCGIPVTTGIMMCIWRECYGAEALRSADKLLDGLGIKLDRKIRRITPMR